METISVPKENPVGISPDLFLVKIIDLNLSGLTIILLLEGQFITISDCSFSIRTLTVLRNKTRCCHLQNFLNLMQPVKFLNTTVTNASF